MSSSENEVNDSQTDNDDDCCDSNENGSVVISSDPETGFDDAKSAPSPTQFDLSSNPDILAELWLNVIGGDDCTNVADLMNLRMDRRGNVLVDFKRRCSLKLLKPRCVSLTDSTEGICLLFGHILKHNANYGPFVGTLRIHQCPLSLVLSEWKNEQRLSSPIIPSSENLRVRMNDSQSSAITEHIVHAVTLDPTSSFVVCGSRGLGKSMFVRLAANALLSRVDRVLILDLDPGKPLFTPRGTLSLIEVNEPLLFDLTSFGQYAFLECKSIKVVRTLFLGYTNVFECPNHYGKVCESLVKLLRSSSYNDETGLTNKWPVLVNTMGWFQGFGIRILNNVVKMIEPNLIVEISRKESNQTGGYTYNQIPIVRADALEEVDALKELNGRYLCERKIVGEVIECCVSCDCEQIDKYIFPRGGKEYEGDDMMSAMAHSNRVALCRAPFNLTNSARNSKTKLSQWKSNLVFVAYGSVSCYDAKNGRFVIRTDERILTPNSSNLPFNSIVLPGMKERAGEFESKASTTDAFISYLKRKCGIERSDSDEKIKCLRESNSQKDMNFWSRRVVTLNTQPSITDNSDL